MMETDSMKFYQNNHLRMIMFNFDFWISIKALQKILSFCAINVIPSMIKIPLNTISNIVNSIFGFIHVLRTLKDRRYIQMCKQFLTGKSNLYINMKT